MSNQPKQKTITVGETEYVLQHPGVRKALQMKDSSRDQHRNIMAEPYYDQIMQHVIVSPKTNWEYWEEHFDDMEEVIGEAVRFLERRE